MNTTGQPKVIIKNERIRMNMKMKFYTFDCGGYILNSFLWWLHRLFLYAVVFQSFSSKSLMVSILRYMIIVLSKVKKFRLDILV